MSKQPEVKTTVVPLLRSFFDNLLAVLRDKILCIFIGVEEGGAGGHALGGHLRLHIQILNNEKCIIYNAQQPHPHPLSKILERGARR